MAGVAWNADERRPRALVRIALHLALFGALSLAAQLPFQMLDLGWIGHGAMFLAMATMAVIATYLACRVLDRRELTSVGVRVDARWGIDLAFGFVLGGVLVLGVGGAEQALGWATYTPTPADGLGAAHLATAFVVFSSVGLVEELIFRGYHIPNLSEGLRGRRLGPRTAVLGATLLSSAGFGLAHVLNPDASLISTTNIAMAGVMLAAGLLMTGELGLSIGLHLSWNYFQNLLDMPVSGQRQFAYAAVVERVEAGPDWLTGGAFGPEAGLTGLTAMLIGTLLIVTYARALERAIRIHPSLLGHGGGKRHAR